MIVAGATATVLVGCSQGSTYLVGPDGAFIQFADGETVSGYFACAAPGRSCTTQAAEACARYDMSVRSVGPLDAEIPVERSGFNYFPIQPNRKVICERSLETKA